MRMTHLKPLRRIRDYLYDDERKNYEVEEMPAGHIFVSVLALQEIIERYSES